MQPMLTNGHTQAKIEANYGGVTKHVNKDMILWKVADAHPYLILLAFPDYMLLADLHDPEAPSKTMVLLKRDYYKFEVDKNLECKIELLYDNFYKDLDITFKKI